MTGSIPRRILAAALLAGSLLVPGALASPPAASAAEDDLLLEATSTYVLDPEAGVVHVEVDVRATNLRPDRETATRIIRYFFRQIFFAIHPESTRIRATEDADPLRVTTRRRESFIQARIHLADPLDYRETTRLQLTYDLPGGAPRSTSEIRVGVAFATFYAWAHGDEDLSTVRIVVPRSFEVEVEGSPISRSERGGRTLFEAAAIGDVARWYVVVVAQREAALTADVVPVRGSDLVVHAWPEDDRWRSRVGEVLARGMPVLQELVGLPWPATGTLDVFEVHSPLLEGYAGFFYTDLRRIEISEDLDDLTILHEASHAWFDSSLLRERWIYEGLADEFASRALSGLGEVENPPEIGPDAPGAIRLNDWGYAGRIDDTNEARELYGYRASWVVMRELVDDVSVTGMRAVLRAADGNEAAYRGEGPPERVGSRDDWRRLLDLLEERAGAERAEDLFRRWVVTDQQEATLDERADTRRQYASLVEDADGWSVPVYVRSQMERWEFERARERIGEAARILGTREAIERLAAEHELFVPPGLEDAWEDARLDLDRSSGIAAAQLSALEEIDAADDILAGPDDPIVELGLLGGASPDATLSAARVAFETGDPAIAVALAEGSMTMLAMAAEGGRTRLIALGGGGLAALVAVGGYGLARVRRRRLTGIDVPPPTTTPYATAAGAITGPNVGGDDRAVTSTEPTPPASGNQGSSG